MLLTRRRSGQGPRRLGANPSAARSGSRFQLVHVFQIAIALLALMTLMVMLKYTPSSPMDFVYSESFLEDRAPFFNESVVEFRDRFQATPIRTGTIFVSIASFRDNLCQKTLKRLFGTAKHPDRIFVGLCDQYDFGDVDDVPCLTGLPARHRQQVRVVRLAADRGRGPTHARYIASKLWSGQQIFMQIDSHSDFLQHWDRHLLDMLRELPARSIVTHYPASSEDELGPGAGPVPWICTATQDQAPPGLVIQLPFACKPENHTPGFRTCFSPFLGAGFFAGDSALLNDAPFDKYLQFLFHGEELLIAARLWTSGWNLFVPGMNLVSHVYGGRPKNVFVQVPDWYIYARRSEARARTILRSPLPEDTDYDRSEINELGLGTQRSLHEFWRYSGVNLQTNNITGRCDHWFDISRNLWRHVSDR